MMGGLAMTVDRVCDFQFEYKYGEQGFWINIDAIVYNKMVHTLNDSQTFTSIKLIRFWLDVWW